MRSNALDAVADDLALQIATGRLRPGDTLPSIRRLAGRYELNPSSIQQVLGRLRMAGFVEPRHGVGVVVRDIRLYGGIQTWQYLFRFSSSLPELTVRNVQEILETLQLFYQAALVKLVPDAKGADPAPARRAFAQLELLAQDGDVRAGDVHRGVLGVLRAVLAGLGGGVTLGLLNSMGDVLAEVPEVLEALYGDASEHVWFWGNVVTAWETGDEGLARETLAVLDAWHAAALARLRDRLDLAGG
ncbi:GntR family transcriptional regulator [Actinomadura sp. WMMB 499]|uniref:GntR family transcriptional regulator n=1 Tax=Actinomadura sp. WMMB 499 TaxID=1219491 RepID=UPI0012475967|nr:GntR family transcriptional regulator [Actinomadura sp. WMMB 499]QFG22575.1 GntR family transcriptional regulator [Actinomadura sp. WMMB 499]